MQKIGVAAAEERLRHARSTRPRPSSRRSASPPSSGPSFTLGGTGGGIAYNRDEFEAICRAGAEGQPHLHACWSRSRVLGWKEYELEVVRDSRGQRHHHLLDREPRPDGRAHRRLASPSPPRRRSPTRSTSACGRPRCAIIREIGVDTGGSNIQFGVNPKDGRMVVIEMNPRVSRSSSALASKATGYPIAKIAAKLALGYTLDELRTTSPATRRPRSSRRIDYVVVKIPRFNFEKFPRADRTLTTTMRSVGEVMAIGRTFKRGLPRRRCARMEAGRAGARAAGAAARTPEARDRGAARGPARAAARAPLVRGPGLPRGDDASTRCTSSRAIDPWFLGNRGAGARGEGARRSSSGSSSCPTTLLRAAKAHGFSDRYLAQLLGTTEADVRAHRHARGHPPGRTSGSTPAPPSSRPTRPTSTPPTRRRTRRRPPTARRC